MVKTMNAYSELISKIDNYIYKSYTSSDEYQKKIYESMTYSLSSGGKRIRPLLSLLTYSSIVSEEEMNYEKILPYATAIELIHTYSLIHDDLPAMDNDDLRRGKPTNHKVFSEAIAILAGDGLLNLACEVMAKDLEKIEDPKELKRGIKAMKYILTASGVHGMIGGQVIDIEFSDDMNVDICETMYKLKTAALIRAAIVSGAIIAGASDEEITTLEEFANCIGIAYQIKDDILDLDQDNSKNKNTVLKFKELEELNRRIQSLTNRAQSNLEQLDFDMSDLKVFTDKLMNRSF